MNRLTSGMVPSFALLLVLGCATEPTEDLRGGLTKLVAAPSQLFLDLGQTKTVEVGGVDAQGNQLVFDYRVTATGTGVAVRRDSTFLPIFIDDSTLAAPATGPRFRFIVTGTAYAQTSFTVSAGGQSVVIPVQVVPQAQIAATFSDTTPALGDTITITAAPGTTFSQTALLQTGDTINPPLIIDRTPDGTSIRFMVPPNLNGPITVTEVTSTGAPTLVFSPATEASLQSPLIDTVDAQYSVTTPTLGQTVTVTIDSALIKFAVDSIIFSDQLPGREADAANIVISPDSTSLTFEAPPNATGPGTFVNFGFPGGFKLALPTRTGITAQNIGTTFAATFSDDSVPPIAAVTLDAPAGFEFADSVAVGIGGSNAIINSVTPTQIDLIPIPGTSGPAVVDGVIPTAAPQFILTMTTVATVAAEALTPLVGTDDPATAPLIPTPGQTLDAGSFDAANCGGLSGLPCQVYRISFPAATTMTFSVEGASPADLGLYFLNAADFSDASQFCDAQGRASPPESCSLSFAAGDYILMVVSFGPLYPELDPDPPFIDININ